MFNRTLRTLLAVVLYPTLVSLSATAVAVPAFPGAQGYGGNALGGRAGQVQHVRNLCDYRQNELVAWQLGGPAARPSHCLDANAKIDETFRWAVEEVTVPRTVVFDVGGEIVLRRNFDTTSGVLVQSPFVTIAGQTAPPPGITLRNEAVHQGLPTILDVLTHDVVVRHVRLRPGAGLGKWENHAVSLRTIGGPNPYNVILDHVSASWATDDLISIQDATDVTVQWSILAESLAFSASQLAAINVQLGGLGPTVIPENNGKGMLLDSSHATPYTGRVSIHHNLFAHHYMRTPQLNAGGRSDVADQSYPVEIVNNVSHDVVRSAVSLLDGDCNPNADVCPVNPPLICTCGSGPTNTTTRRRMRTNVIGNTFSLSAATLVAYPPPGSRTRFLPSPPFGSLDPWNPRELLLDFLMTNPSSLLPANSAGMQVYVAGNRSWRRNASNQEISPAATDSALPLCTGSNGHWFPVSNCLVSTYLVPGAHPYAAVVPAVTVEAGAVAETNVFARAGALYWDADVVDKRIVSESKLHTGTLASALNPTIPPIVPGARPAGYDVDGDGMPGVWEVANGLLPAVADGNLDPNSDGYTNLEDYLAEAATDTDGDGVVDAFDNCVVVANGPLRPDAGGQSQLDADSDGYGNICDGDLNNSGVVTTADSGILQSVINQSATSSPTAAKADMNGSGTVTTADFALLRASLSQPPGPAGLAP